MSILNSGIVSTRLHSEIVAAIRRLGSNLNSEHGLDIYCRTLNCDGFSDSFNPPHLSRLNFEQDREILGSILDMDRIVTADCS